MAARAGAARRRRAAAATSSGGATRPRAARESTLHERWQPCAALLLALLATILLSRSVSFVSHHASMAAIQRPATAAAEPAAATVPAATAPAAGVP